MDTNDTGTKKDIHTIGKLREKEARKATKETKVEVIVVACKRARPSDFIIIDWWTEMFRLEDGKGNIIWLWKITEERLNEIEQVLRGSQLTIIQHTRILQSCLISWKWLLFLIPFYLLVVFFLALCTINIDIFLHYQWPFFYRWRNMLKSRQMFASLAPVVSSEKTKFVTYYKYIICSRPFPEAS